MSNCKHGLNDDERLVGDPIDVVSGANVEVNFEFQLRGPLPLVWRRHYDSSKVSRQYRLGWGHTDEFDRKLEYDVDGIRYTGPVSKVVGFPPLARDGDQFASGGLILRRVTPEKYHVFDDKGPGMEFEFHGSRPVAPLKALRKQKAAIEFYYGGNGELAGIRDSLGRYIRVDCDDQSRIMALVLTKPEPATARTLMTFRYDSVGNLVEGVDAYNHSFGFAYDEHNRLVTRTDRRGYSFLFEYDQAGRCVQSRGEDGLHEVKLRYLPAERVTIVTKADGGEWTYFYDENKVITKIIDPYGGVRNFEVEPSGRVIGETDPKGNPTKWVYGAGGARIGKRSSLGYFSSDPEGPARPDQKIHRIPRCPVEWEYGDLLPVRNITLPAADDPLIGQFPPATRQLIRTARQETSRTLTPRQTDHSQDEDSKTYDELGLLIREAGPNGSARRWIYDAGGNTQRFHDYDGATYKYEYTSWDLCSREIDPAGHAVRYSYTPTGKIATITDGGENSSHYTYDHKDRLIQVRRHGVIRETYRYDQADNLVEKLDGQGKLLLKFEIGPENLKTARHLSSGETHEFVYNKKGLYAEVKSNNLAVQFDYDRFDNRTLDARAGMGVKHKFNGPGDLAKTTVLNHFTVSYDRLEDGTIQITDPGGKRHFIRRPGSGIVIRELSNGSTERAQYDSDGRCLFKEITSTRPLRRASRSYTYSAEGDLLLSEDDADFSVRYEYDLAHRLKSATHLNGNRDDFHYDAAGNLLQQPGLSDVGIVDGNRLLRANGEQFEYNDRNHIAVRKRRNETIRYKYDSRDMLVSCDTPQGEWQAAYDPLGRRTSKSHAGERTEFYWDTDRLAAEIGPEGRVRIYFYVDAFAMTPFLFVDYESANADPKTGKAYFLFTNHLAAPVRVEDENGRVVWRARLDAYGTAHVSSDSSIEMALRFPGHYLDAETGLHYNRFRYYSPEFGRYIQSDPLGIPGGTNLYAYTSNPLKNVDVRGDCGTGSKTPPEDEGTPEDGSDDEGQWEAMMRAPAAEEEPPPEIPWDQVQASREAYARAAAAAADLVEDSGRPKTVAAAGDGMYASGTEPVPGFDHVPVGDVRTGLDGGSNPPGSTLFPPSDPAFLDNGDPGSYNASHAEMQAATAQPGQPIGVSRPVCDNCGPALSQVAQDSGQPQVITDPNGTHVYHPNGGHDFLGWD